MHYCGGAGGDCARGRRELILIDAAQLLISDSGLKVFQSEHAALQMSDTPTQSSVTPTATQLVSAFQANVVVLKFLRYLSWALLRADGAGFIELPVGGPRHERSVTRGGLARAITLTQGDLALITRFLADTLAVEVRNFVIGHIGVVNSRFSVVERTMGSPRLR